MKLVQEITLKGLRKRTKALVLLMGIACYLLVVNVGHRVGVPRLITDDWRYFVLLFACLIGSIPVHELLHGLFFRLFTGKVKFGVTAHSGLGLAFFATSPDSLMVAWKYQIIALAPQFMTIILFVLAILVPSVKPANILLLTAAVNLAGGCADIYAVKLVSKHNYRKTMVKDTKTGMEIYSTL